MVTMTNGGWAACLGDVPCYNTVGVYLKPMSTPHAFAPTGRVVVGVLLLSAALVLPACKPSGADAGAKPADAAEAPVPVETERVARRSVAASWVGTASLEVPRGADDVCARP